jgi:glycosyltransferase involved in cell wall biosynthesis
VKIAIYDDNPDFGGHQIMACHGIDALRADPSVNIAGIINPANQKLIHRLEGIPIVHPGSDIRAIAPDLLLCLQGDIAQCTKGIKAAHRVGVECISYLALPHRRADMGAKLGALRDRINRQHLNTPDRFITISDSMKNLLIERGCTKPIVLVPNGIAVPPPRKPQPSSMQTIGLAGRIEFKQKQQDFLVRSFLSEPAFNNCRLIIAGSGPDEEKLRAMIRGIETITLMPWQTQMEAFYEQIDLLVIPSRYEGVPLVMLEALARGIPVIGSNRDGMRDTLPPEWRFEPGNAHALGETFIKLRETHARPIEAIRKMVLENHAMDRFKQHFVQAVTAP